MRQNLRSGLLEIIRNNASPDWLTFPKSLHPMDSPVILTNHKHISAFSTNHQLHPQLGKFFLTREESAKEYKILGLENQLSLFQ